MSATNQKSSTVFVLLNLTCCSEHHSTASGTAWAVPQHAILARSCHPQNTNNNQKTTKRQPKDNQKTTKRQSKRQPKDNQKTTKRQPKDNQKTNNNHNKTNKRPTITTTRQTKDKQKKTNNKVSVPHQPCGYPFVSTSFDFFDTWHVLTSFVEKGTRPINLHLFSKRGTFRRGPLAFRLFPNGTHQHVLARPRVVRVVVLGGFFKTAQRMFVGRAKFCRSDFSFPRQHGFAKRHQHSVAIVPENQSHRKNR